MGTILFLMEVIVEIALATFCIISKKYAQMK